MAYDKTKLYWLKLKEDFFDEEIISFIEEQPNGKEYVLFYLKLCIISMKNNGTLIRKVGDMFIPYDYIKIAQMTKTNPDTVLIAMELLLMVGLIQKLDNGDLFITQLNEMTICKTAGAVQKQMKRQEISNQLSIPNEEAPIEDVAPKKVVNNDKIMESFDKFWYEYPKKVGKAECIKWFKKNKPNDELVNKMIETIKKFKTSENWLKENGQYIPTPHRWLNRGGWDDELEIRYDNNNFKNNNDINEGWEEL